MASQLGKQSLVINENPCADDKLSERVCVIDVHRRSSGSDPELIFDDESPSPFSLMSLKESLTPHHSLLLCDKLHSSVWSHTDFDGSCHDHLAFVFVSARRLVLPTVLSGRQRVREDATFEWCRSQAGRSWRSGGFRVSVGRT